MKFLKNMKNTVSMFFLFFIVQCINSCDSSKPEQEMRMVAPKVKTEGVAGGAMNDKAFMQDNNASSVSPQQGGAFENSERKIIKTANITMEIEKYTAWNDGVLKLVQNSGGYIVNSSTQKIESNVMRGNVVIRVPQEKFNELLKNLKSTAKNLENESLGGQDVSEEYYDLEARLANKQKTEIRFQEILKAARNVEDILKVEQELSRIREEIEQMLGRKKFLDSQVSYSTITVEWHEAYPLGVSGGQGFWAKVGDGFKNGINGFGDVLGGVIAFVIGGLPFFALLFLIGWIAVKLRRSQHGRKVSAVEVSSEKDNSTGDL